MNNIIKIGATVPIIILIVLLTYFFVVAGQPTQTIQPTQFSLSLSSAHGTIVPEESITTYVAITLMGNNPVTIEIGSTYGDLGATVTDNVNDNLGYKVSVDNGPEIYPNEIQIDTSVAGEHTIIFTAVDQAGNIGTATRVVNVIALNAPSEPPPAP
jgi:hypothetical protein